MSSFEIELLQQMSIGIDGIRPRIISAKTRDLLKEFMENTE